MTSFKSVPTFVAYYNNLHLSSVVNALRYRFQDKAIVYAIRCRPSGMMYIGHTFNPTLRFHNHLITGVKSNPYLQTDIAKRGLSKFTVYILEVTVFPKHLSYNQRTVFMRTLEQQYIDRYPREQLYNIINASA